MRKQWNWICLICAVLLPVAYWGTVRAMFIPEGRETSEDAFWHVAAGRRSLTEMVDRKFPLTLSVWRDHYADKELMFHLLIKGWGAVEKLFSSSPLSPPFTGASCLFMLLFFGMFVTAAHSLGTAPPKILLASLLCGMLIPNFTYRLMMLRPHVLSMALMMGAVALLAQGPRSRAARFGIFGLGFLYAWSYSSPHLLCVTAFLFGIGYFSREKLRGFLPFVLSVAGVFCGLLIHPQSPNTFLIWKVQALDALLAPLAGNSIQLPFARELLPPRFHWLLLALPALAAVYFCLMGLIRIREKESWKEMPPNLLALGCCTLFWTGAMCVVSIRPVEYAVPMICLTGFPLLDHLRERGLFRCLSHTGAVWGGVAALIVLCGVYTTQNCVENLKIWCSPSPQELAEALRKHVPAGAKVVNIVWSDFPYLSFAAPEYEYAWALDPMFSYAYDPERTEELGRFGRDGRRRRPGKLAALMDADYAVVVFDTNVVGRFLERSGWRPLYRGKDGWLFRLR